MLDLSTCWNICRAGSPKSSRKGFAPLLWKTLSGTLIMFLSVHCWCDQRSSCLLLCVTSHSNGGLCQCGGARDAHASVALGDYFGAAIINHWDSAQHSSESPTDAFGELQFAGSSKRHSYVGGILDQCWLENVNSLTFNHLQNTEQLKKYKQLSLTQHSCSIFGVIYLSFFTKLMKHLLRNTISDAVSAAVLGYASIYGLHLDDGPLGASCS